MRWKGRILLTWLVEILPVLHWICWKDVKCVRAEVPQTLVRHLKWKVAVEGFVAHVCIRTSWDTHCGQKKKGNSSVITKQKWENISGKDGYLGDTQPVPVETPLTYCNHTGERDQLIPRGALWWQCSAKIAWTKETGKFAFSICSTSLPKAAAVQQ